MRLDKYSNSVFNEQDLFRSLYQGYTPSPNDQILVEERSQEIKNLESILGFKFLEPYETHFEISNYDQACQTLWYMPDSYKSLDIDSLILSQCQTQDQINRVREELDEFKSRDMLNLLRFLKYLVDTLRENNIVWGVGRGSSVASYVLYLLGVHKINSLEYNLDWREFLR